MIRQNTQTSNRNSVLINCLGLITVFGVLCGFFLRSIFGGRPIAKLDLLTSIDALYNQSLQQAIVALPCDPSGSLIFYPFGQFAHQSWAKLVAPLWNPYPGCGYPLVGDPQSFIFSVVHLVGVFSSVDAYNFGLLAEIFVGAFGVYVFARNRHLSIPASMFASLSYALVPRNLAQIDLSGAECFYPWLFFLFARLAQKPVGARILAAAAGVCVAAYSSHPETAFFAVLYATVFAVCMMVFGQPPKTDYGSLLTEGDTPSATEGGAGSVPVCPTPHSPGSAGVPPASGAASVRDALLSGLPAIGAVALISVCLTAPLTLPFFEFLKNAYFYKDATGGASFIPVDRFFLSLYAAQGSESYFLGAVALLLLPVGLYVAARHDKPLLTTTLICLLVTVPVAAFQQLLSIKPLSYIATLYGVPELLMLLALVAGRAVDGVTQEKPGTGKLATVVPSGVLIASVPCIVAYFNAASEDFDLVLQVLGQQRQLLQSLTLIASVAVVLILSRRFLNKVPVCLFAAGLLALNLVSIGSTTRQALPLQKKFDYPLVPALASIPPGARTAAAGSNLFLANTGSCNEVADLRCFSPLVSERYHQFVTACGASSHNLYFLCFPDAPSRLLDLASVKYFLTRTAACSGDDLTAPGRQSLSVSAGRLGPRVRLNAANLSLDTVNAQIDGTLQFKVQGGAVNRYAVQLVVASADGSVLRSNPQHILKGDSFLENLVLEPVHMPVSTNEKVTGDLSLALRVIDTWTGQSMVQKTSVFPELASGLKLCSFSPQAVSALGVNESNGSRLDDSGRNAGRHYQLVFDSARDGLRTYKNRLAVPAAYSISRTDALFTTSAAESLSCIKEKINPWRQVCIEDQTRLLVSSTGENSESAGATGAAALPNADQCSAHDASTVKLASANANSKLNLATPNDEAMSTSNCIKSQKCERPDCNTVVVNADCSTPSYLVLTDLYYPGWRCTVDGREVSVYPANYLFRAVEVPAGRHTVRFVFLPPSFSTGLWVVLICLLGISLIALLRVKKPLAKSAG